MAIELITGRAGVPHVDSFDVGAFNATMFGGGAYVLEGVTATLVDANNVNVNAGELLCEGRHIRITGAGEDLVIENGLSAYKRHDVIAIKYLRDEDGIETTELVVIKGESVIDNPVDPAMPTSGKLIEGASEVYWPLFRIVIDGLTPQTPVFIAQRQAVYTLGLGTEIPAGADLNDYKEPGNYFWPNNGGAIPANTAFPSGAAFDLKVEKVKNGVYEITRQIIKSTNNSMTGMRVTVGTGWSDWVFTGGIDSIVAEGTTGVWRWSKFANGNAIAYAANIVTTTGGINRAFGALYSSPTRSLTFPFNFTTIPYVGMKSINGYMPVPFDNSLTKTNYEWRYVNSQGDASAQMSVIAIGRWK